MALDLWSVNPSWQNFSSMYREACAASEAPTDFEKSHHLTAALYFGIASIESFLNLQMRAHLGATKCADEIFNELRQTGFLRKLRRWPNEITGKDSPISSDVLEFIDFCNSVRGDLTHPKTAGHDIYEKLLTVKPNAIVDAVAQCIVGFHQAQKTRFPYWVFGWNYLNPSQGIHQIVLFNDQQFCHSLSALGFKIPSFDYHRAEAWKNNNLTSTDGYVAIRDKLQAFQHCEPKFDRFPYMPKLCRRWWTAEHQKSCGYVSEQSLSTARKLDGA